jgi:hypothetical protein
MSTGGRELSCQTKGTGPTEGHAQSRVVAARGDDKALGRGGHGTGGRCPRPNGLGGSGWGVQHGSTAIKVHRVSGGAPSTGSSSVPQVTRKHPHVHRRELGQGGAGGYAVYGPRGGAGGVGGARGAGRGPGVAVLSGWAGQAGPTGPRVVRARGAYHLRYKGLGGRHQRGGGQVSGECDE